ncbi:MAG: hypothetical protein KBE04_15305 [Phycisphaerae bacterium]|nr:hypothetical protein [Phycisphaerae bacterium]
MALVEVNWNPDSRTLRRFSWVAALACTAIAAVLHVHRGLDLRWCAWIVGAGGAVAASPFVSLGITRAVYRVLVGATLPIGLAVSLILMGVVYYGLITPLGLVFRLAGRDPLRRRFDPGARTYWLEHHAPDGPQRYFQQF